MKRMGLRVMKHDNTDPMTEMLLSLRDAKIQAEKVLATPDAWIECCAEGHVDPLDPPEIVDWRSIRR
jgi:hypothetical protein